MLTRDRLLFWILLFTTSLLVALSFAIAFPLVSALTWAAVLAILVRRFHIRIEASVRNRSIAALISVVLVAVVIVAPLVFVSIDAVQEIRSGVKAIQSAVQSGALSDTLDRHSTLVHAYNWLNDRVDLVSVGTDIAKFFQSQVAVLAGKTVGTIVQGFISLFALFFFLRDRRLIFSAIRSHVPLSDSEALLLSRRIATIVRATVFGRMLTALIQGALGGLMFWILGIPATLLWGVIMSVLSMIPAVGAVFIWAPASLWLALSGHWVKAIILAAWGSAVVGTIDNVVYPLFVGRDVKIHTLLLFVALLGGVILFGTTGLVLGPVVMEMTLTLIEILRERMRQPGPLDQAS
jgi:predicted PurR-regulated permease PerM